VHPTLVTMGPWRLVHLPLVFAFFLAIVGLWTWLERRGEGRPIRLTWALALELTVQAALPAIATWVLVSRVGPLQIRSYGVMMLAAFAAALTWMYIDRARYDFTRGQVLQVALLGFAGASRAGAWATRCSTGRSTPMTSAARSTSGAAA